MHISVAEPAGAGVACSPLCECACVCAYMRTIVCGTPQVVAHASTAHTMRPPILTSAPRINVSMPYWLHATRTSPTATRRSAQPCELNPVLDSSGGSPGRFQAKRLFLVDPATLSDLCSHASAARTEKEARQATFVVVTRTQQHARGAAQPCACQLPYTVEDDVQRMPAARDTPRAPSACKMRTS